MHYPDLSEIAARYGAELILLFGSAVSERLHEHSDLDLAVQLDDPNIDFHQFATLTHDLQKVFPEREVDLCILNRADPLFLKKITENCRLLYGPPRRLLELKIYGYKRYQDHRPYFAMEREYVRRFLLENCRPR